MKLTYLFPAICVATMLFRPGGSANADVVPIVNPDFESDVSGWEFFPYPSDAGGNMAWQPYNAPESTGGAMLLGGGFAYQDLTTTIAPNADYTLSASLRNHNDSPLQIMFNLIAVESNAYIIDMRPRLNGVWDKPLAVGEWGTWTETVHAEDIADYIGETLRVQAYVSSAWAHTDHYSLTATSGGYELSRGRQLLLDRGLQIQSLVSQWYGFDDINRWQESNFTTVNVWGQRGEPLMSQLPEGTQWGCLYERPDAYWAPDHLRDDELPYVDSFVSFQYRDELDGLHGPNIMEMLPEVAATFERWRTDYPNTIAYTNSPGFGIPFTSAELATYMAVAKPDMIMHDTYPDNAHFYATSTAAGGGWYIRGDWYKQMQRYRIARLAGIDGSGRKPIPYAQFINLFRPDPDSPLPSESFVRLQYNASWAFGYTFIDGFVYNDPWPGHGVASVLFDSAGDDSPTPVFDYVAEANRQSLNLGPALIRMVSTDIRMIPGKINGATLSLPDGIESWASGDQNTGVYTDYITSVTQRGVNNTASPSNCSDVLIGYFNPLQSDNTGYTFVEGLHFMIVNGAVGSVFASDDPAGDLASDSAEWFRLVFDFQDSGFDSLVRLSRDTRDVELVTLQHLAGAQYQLDLQLDGGTGDLFGFWNSSHPLPMISGPTLGDLDGNFYVDNDDLCIIVNNWGQTVIPGDLLSGDITGDGLVNADDLDIVQANWNKGTPPIAAVSVPEPGALLMLFGGLMLLALWRRRWVYRPHAMDLFEHV